MKKRNLFPILAALSIAAFCIAQDAPRKKASASGHKSHIVVAPDGLKWGPPPATWIKGTPPADFPPLKSQFAVVSGDPMKPGALFVIRIKSPDGEKIPPHWRPPDEHITVLQGTFNLAAGEKFDDKPGHELSAGSYAMMPKRTMHFGWTTGDTIVQVHGIGPFAIIFGKVEPAAPKPATGQ